MRDRPDHSRVIGLRIDGPMQNSYLRLDADPATGGRHPVLAGLEDAPRIINGVFRIDVRPSREFPSPVTLIPSYPDLPMEDVFPRVPRTDIRELYLRHLGSSRIVYFPWDVDRTFWEVMAADHGRLLGNAVRWAANEPAPVDVDGPSVLDVTARIRLGDGMRPARVQLLTAAATPQTTFANGVLSVVVPSVDVHEVIAIDLEP